MQDKTPIILGKPSLQPTLVLYRDCSQNIENLFEVVPQGVTRRFDCPFCAGKNTLTITKEGGRVLYRCMRNSCNLHTGGSRLLKATKDAILSTIASRTALGSRTEANREFRLPPYMIEGIPSKKAFQMLLNWNSIEAYTDGMFKVAYDPRSNRLVFLIQENGITVGAVGRAIDTGTKPKVITYPNTKKVPFKVGKGDKVVLVEDCFSACSIARVQGYVGLALLGTHMLSEYLYHIVMNYQEVIIALDPDAYAKSFKMKKSIEYYVPSVKIWKLSTDLKNMGKTKIQEFIEQHRTPIII